MNAALQHNKWNCVLATYNGFRVLFRDRVIATFDEEQMARDFLDLTIAGERLDMLERQAAAHARDQAIRAVEAARQQRAEEAEAAKKARRCRERLEKDFWLIADPIAKVLQDAPGYLINCLAPDCGRELWGMEEMKKRELVAFAKAERWVFSTKTGRGWRYCPDHASLLQTTAR